MPRKPKGQTPETPAEGAPIAAPDQANGEPKTSGDSVGNQPAAPAAGEAAPAPTAPEGQASAPPAPAPKRSRKKKAEAPAAADAATGASADEKATAPAGGEARAIGEGEGPKAAGEGPGAHDEGGAEGPACETEPAAAVVEAPKAEKAAKAPRKKKAAGKSREEMTVPELVDHVLAEERVVYFPVKHFSAACAMHVDRLIRELKPVAVLVEGPDDATPLVPFIVHDDTRPPFTIFSSYVDRDNTFAQNGILSPSENMPARFRGWWPFVEYAPEYAALKAGKEVGAQKLAFIDAPLVATIPYHHVPRHEGAQMVNDRHLAESAYFEALRQRQRRRSFEEFWNANFEVSSQHLSTPEFMKAVLTFAHCARLSGGGEAEGGALDHDGTLLREAHMRWHIDQTLKEIPEGRVVVVTGAFHSVALPFTKGGKAKAKPDKNLETLLTAHSFQALATLYELNKLPAYGQAVWEALKAGSPEPWNAAAIQLLIEIMRKAREAKEGVSTADSVGAYHVARNLAVLRRDLQATLEDVVDAVNMTYVKGDVRVRGGEIERATREVLVGSRLGRVTSEAGQAPLVRDYYASCKAHKLDVTGNYKEVRCDVGKQEDHRLKSAFLHQATFLEIPMFRRLDKAEWNAALPHYKGPNIATGEHMDLIIEQWGVQWGVKVDDRLLELSDRGATVSQAAANLLREHLLKAKGNAADTTKLLLRSVQMMLLELFDELLSAVEDAIVQDASFHNMVKALSDFVVLLSYRQSLPDQVAPRVMSTITTLFNKACLLLPMAANTQPEGVRETLDDLQTLVRITLTFEAIALDRALLTEKLAEMVTDQDGSPAIRGAGFGVLYSFGATSEKAVARELDGYLLGSSERVLQAGAFLDGLFMSSKSIFMGSPRLLRAIGGVIRQLDWATFKILLPDLRRAFTQFIPSEIDSISAKVSEEVGLAEPPPRDQPVTEALSRVGASADRKVAAVMAEWI